MKKAFTVDELTTLLVNQVVMADADMQLRQGAAWRSLVKDTPLASGASHLDFLGLDEVTLRLGLTPHRNTWMKWISWLLPFIKPKMENLKLVPMAQAHFELSITIKRTLTKRFEKQVSTNTPDGLTGKRIVV